MATTIPQRDLRNDVSSVLRRVEAGEEFIVTVSGRPVAELRPVQKRGGLAAFRAGLEARGPLRPEVLSGLQALDTQLSQWDEGDDERDPWEPQA